MLVYYFMSTNIRGSHPIIAEVMQEDFNYDLYIIEVKAREDFDREQAFDAGNGYGPYAEVRNLLPRSFSVGDVFAYEGELTGPNGRFHFCDSIGWITCDAAIERESNSTLWNKVKSAKARMTSAPIVYPDYSNTYSQEN